MKLAERRVPFNGTTFRIEIPVLKLSDNVLALLGVLLGASAGAAATPLKADFSNAQSGPVPSKVPFVGWVMEASRPGATAVDFRDGQLALRDADESDAAVATFTAEEPIADGKLKVLARLQVDTRPRVEGDDANRYAFLRFGPRFDNDLGFVRFILPAESLVVVDVSDADGLAGPENYGERKFPLDQPLELALSIDFESQTYDVMINGRMYVDGARLAGGVEGALGSVSLHTPSTGSADLLVDHVRVGGEVGEILSRDEPTAELRALMANLPLGGGRVIDTPGFDMDDAEAAWQFQPHIYYDFIKDEAGINAWKSIVELPRIGRHLYSLETFDIAPNRRYRVTALVKADFDRLHNEVDLGVEMLDTDRNRLPGLRGGGLPARTSDDPENVDGWVRWNWEFLSPSYDMPVVGRFVMRHHIGDTDYEGFDLRMAQVELIELPADQLDKTVDPADLVQFRGGPGELPMAVEAVETEGDVITVTTTGVKYTFDTANNRVSARQRIDFKRDLFDADFSLPLAGLTVIKQDDVVAVLQNDVISIGIQCDGMAAVVATEPLSVTSTARIAGVFNRAGRGSIYAGDDMGGFAVNSYPIMGSGNKVDMSLLTGDLWFAGLEPQDTETLQETQPGWQARWDLRPGERIFLSGFPCRPFDWEQSFNEHYLLTSKDTKVEEYDSDWTRIHDVIIMWDFHAREWGMGYADNYTPLDPDQITAHIEAINAQGAKAMAYNSAFFHRSRDPDVWVESVRRLVEDEGFQGMYSDGLPTVDWLVGYEELRMLREQILPDGPIRIHDSLPQSGRHTAEYSPWVYTYASTTYMAEHVATEDGPGWPWVRYVISSYRQSNAIADIKGDKWRGFGGDEPNQQTKSRLAGFLWNARPSSGAPHYMRDIWPVWSGLYEDWQEHGDDPYYYDRYYTPLVQELTGFRVGRAGMPMIEVDDGKVTLSTRSTGETVTIHYTLDGSVPTADSPIYKGPVAVNEGQTLSAITIADGLEPSLPAMHPLPTD